MPDAMLLLKASVLAAVLAAIAVLLAGNPWRQPRTPLVAIGGVLGIAGGFLAGVWLLGLTPSFPPTEDQDRLLLIVLPAVVIVEMGCAFLGNRPWAAWLLRLMVAAGAAPVLLHGSVYLSGAAGADALAWSPIQTALILGLLGTALLAQWALLDRLAQRRAGSVVLLSLAVATGGAGIVIMLSGYSSGGQLGPPLAAALGGAALAGFVLMEATGLRGVLGLGLVGLFALLVIGRFFGSLTTTNAALLFAAPLLGWLPELPFVQRLGPRLRQLAHLALTVLPVAAALTFAVQAFVEASKPRTFAPSNAVESSPSDYLNFGK
ncbi:MAG: hypothetical protein JNM56_38625 [Planctomycetia bacterium]|nr:hypothetical protein [Planctomycetia bacterium]